MNSFYCPLVEFHCDRIMNLRFKDASVAFGCKQFRIFKNECAKWDLKAWLNALVRCSIIVGELKPFKKKTRNGAKASHLLSVFKMVDVIVIVIMK